MYYPIVEACINRIESLLRSIGVPDAYGMTKGKGISEQVLFHEMNCTISIQTFPFVMP